MQRVFVVLFATSIMALTGMVSAQTPVPMPSITVADQLSLDGSVMIPSVTAQQAGWIAIHPLDADNVPGPVIGIAPVPVGLNESIRVPIDVLGATPSLQAVLHVDDNTVGVFENEANPSADAPVSANGTPISAPFSVTAIRAYDQMSNNNTIVIASAVVNQPAWVVIYADQNGQAGQVIGQAPVNPGTTPTIIVTLQTAPPSRTVWASLHSDIGQLGVFEFNGQGSNDLPISVNGVAVSTPINLTDTVPVVTADGAPVATTNNQFPALSASNAAADVMAVTGTTSNLLVDSVYTSGPGWLDVHADAGTHPGKSLGMAPLPGGQLNSVTVALDALMLPSAPPASLTARVWPMLHADTGQQGVWEFMRVPGADLPIVVNGAVVTFPVQLFNPPLGTAEATATAEVTATEEITATATVSDDDEDDEDVTETPEATASGTESPGDPSGTAEPTAEATDDNGGPSPTAEVTSAPSAPTAEATP